VSVFAAAITTSHICGVSTYQVRFGQVPGFVAQHQIRAFGQDLWVWQSPDSVET